MIAQDQPLNSSFEPLKVLIADDHALIREGLHRVLLATGHAWLVDGCADGHEAIDILRRNQFDLLISDLSMPGIGGLELIKRVRQEHPKLRILALSMHAEEQYALRAFRSGAHGYLCKGSAGKELVAAIQKVMSGRPYVPAEFVDMFFMKIVQGSDRSGEDRLTDRELEVLRRFVQGQRPADIADALCISVKTVSSHKMHILEKLHLTSTAAMIRYGVQMNVDGVGRMDKAEVAASISPGTAHS